MSDIDICVFTAGDLPSPQIRRQAYAGLGFKDPIYFDVDFENSRGDGFLIGGTRCDFNWMSIPAVRAFLQGLETEFDCSEHIPGGLAAVKELHDPDKVIAGLQSEIPRYSDARAEHRIRKAIQDARFTLYDLGWLEKAAFRNDCFLFFKYEYSLLDTLVRALFALNHVWLSDEKGLVKRMAGFPFAPEKIGTRIQSVILHQQAEDDLKVCLSSLKKLLADTVQSVHRRYPGLDLPVEWK